MCRPPRDDALAVEAVPFNYEDIYGLNKTQTLPCKEPPTRRSRACYVLCCGAPPTCHKRNRCCVARWSARVAAWAVLLLGIVAFYVAVDHTRGEGEVSVESRRSVAWDDDATEAPVAAFAHDDGALGDDEFATFPPVPRPTSLPTLAPSLCVHSEIVVIAEGFKNDDGVAKLWVHDDADQWNKDKDVEADWDDDAGAMLVDSKPIKDKYNVNWTIPIPVSVGNYGVLVLHDKDENGKMKTNSVGKPKEGVGASRGASGSWKGGPRRVAVLRHSSTGVEGPPAWASVRSTRKTRRWSKAKFWVHDCSIVTVSVDLWYS